MMENDVAGVIRLGTSQGVRGGKFISSPCGAKVISINMTANLIYMVAPESFR